jgi:hypothetical protein
MDRKAQRLKSVTESLARAESKVREKEGFVRQFTAALDQLVASSAADWKPAVRELHRRFVADADAAATATANAVSDGDVVVVIIVVIIVIVVVVFFSVVSRAAPFFEPA